MYELTDLRNRTVHDKRFVLHPDIIVVRFEVTAPKELHFAPTPETIEELEQIRTRIIQKLREFNQIRDKIDDMKEKSSAEILNRPFPTVLAAKDRRIGQMTDVQSPPRPPRPSPA
jgi:hypothetical protein